MFPSTRGLSVSHSICLSIDHRLNPRYRGAIGAWIKNVEPVQDEVIEDGHSPIDEIEALQLT